MSRAHLFPRKGPPLEVVGTTPRAMVGRPRPKHPTSPLTAAPPATPAPAPAETGSAYEENLRKQIYFLELEVRYLKERAALAAESPLGPAPRPFSAVPAPMPPPFLSPFPTAPPAGGPLSTPAGTPLGLDGTPGDPPPAFYAPLPPQHSSTVSETRPHTATPPYPPAPSETTTAVTVVLGPQGGGGGHRSSHTSSTHTCDAGIQPSDFGPGYNATAPASPHHPEGSFPLAAEASPTYTPTIPTAPVLVSAATSTDFAHQRRMSAAIQATAHPARSVATSQTPQLPQVLQMHTGIQTHVPKAGVGVQVQHPSQSATTQTGVTQLVLNGTQTTPRGTPLGTPRGRADPHAALLPLLAQSLEQVQAQAQGVGATAALGEEAQELALLSEQVRALRDQYVLREEAHRSELAEERQRLLLERQEMEKSYLAQLEAQTRELQRQVDLLTEEKAAAHQDAIAEIVELQKVIEADCFKATAMSSELEAATIKLDAQMQELQRSTDAVRSLEALLEAERSAHRRTTQDWQTSQEQLTTCKLLLKEYKSRPSAAEAAEMVGLRQQLTEAEAEARQLGLRLTQATFDKTQEVDRNQKLEEELRRLMDAQVTQQQREARGARLKLEAEAESARLAEELKAAEEQRTLLEEESVATRNLLETQREELAQLRVRVAEQQPLLAEKDLQIHRLNEALQKAKRDLLAREDHYATVDGDNATLRKENRLLREEADHVRRALQEWKARCEELETLCGARQGEGPSKRSTEVEVTHTQLDQVVHTNLKVATKLENLMRLLPATQLPQSPFASRIGPPP